MVLRRNSSFTRNGFLKRAKPIKKLGSRGLAWQKLRNEKFARDKDEEGLVRCQDYLIGLPKCGIARSEMDLHHINGRDGKLLLDENNLVWLTRECHEKAHGR